MGADRALPLPQACRLAGCPPWLARRAVRRGIVQALLEDGEQVISSASLQVLRHLAAKRREYDRRRRAPQQEGSILKFIVKPRALPGRRESAIT